MRIWIILVLGILGFSRSFAAEPPVQGPLTLDQALVAVLENNPKLLAGDYKHKPLPRRFGRHNSQHR